MGACSSAICMRANSPPKPWEITPAHCAEPSAGSSTLDNHQDLRLTRRPGRSGVLGPAASLR